MQVTAYQASWISLISKDPTGHTHAIQWPLRKEISKKHHLVVSVTLIHSRGFVHGDIRLRNVLVKLPSTFDELLIERLGKDCKTPVAKMAPEALFEPSDTRSSLARARVRQTVCQESFNEPQALRWRDYRNYRDIT
ncbi:hypothetical protein SODALDRAFT_208720 [Sodiomyces alkalinus F11]|uniref:non-specific serine/threonine protein kinase n=1 Tax=Sodiomyces alkalinus (strain CBS 110278 / VKM F-3762 / F11) TaxID=1314773 RepID=A0A3N2PQX6_SODAK|nr:hypothetical protein SODALDRAFT_208720 [Sodiomyces alkalinus F11]ROT36854.1 hypothetical protein SODALDRAFT_208720 [Sodiomyces alkalinus F11]